METRPELLLLPKTMAVVEGVARSLDPDHNIWVTVEPAAREWVEANLGVAGRLREAGEGAELFGKLAAQVPRLLERAAGCGSTKSRSKASRPLKRSTTAGPAGPCGQARWR